MSGGEPGGAQGAAVAPSEVFAAAMLGGPLAGAWMLAQNEKVLGSAARARAIRWLGVGATLGLLVVLANLETLPPPYLVPLLCAGVVGSISNRLHREGYERHLGAGGRKRSFWWVAGVCLVSVLATLVMGIAVAMTLGAGRPPGG